jgi:phenylpropionate dioxygenase-like ring-hydroxylating dioxygenase large terminal subunit
MKILPLLFLPNLWYPIGKLPEKALQQYNFFDEKYVAYQNKQGNLIIHTDTCPHQGASLSKGWINKNGCLHCPYHGFEFSDGLFCRIPDPSHEPPMFRSKNQMKLLPSKNDNSLCFVSPNSTSLHAMEDIFYPPEEKNMTFRAVEGFKVMPTNHQSVCENLLDMLHISYVHSFGSRTLPLPFSMKFKMESPYHGRSEFFYHPNDNTISSKIGNVNTVRVENEFILPTNTVTRVFAGNTIKTVFTRSIPISETKTLLYWKVYRNFWTNFIGDWLMKYLMEKTIQEDYDILKDVSYKHREGSIKTKYDRTILEFRKAQNQHMQI